jgi:O-acetyl-ADP-ribose deacetylase (regulator of RNase III)
MADLEFRIGEARIVLVQGDITEIEADAIVNAANSSLMGGGGVDGAIHHKGGPKILEECNHIRATLYPEGLPTGKAIMTSGGNLKAKHVIHTVGPVWSGGNRDEAKLLADAYWNSLDLAITHGLRTVAFPSISTGAFGYPINHASKVAFTTVKKFLEERDGFDKVVFVLFSTRDLEAYREALKKEIME